MDSNEQAKYRVFVLEFLRAKYKEVNIDLVKNLAQSLMIEYLKQGWKKSRDLDLVDAFTILIKNEKNRNPYFNPEDFVESLNYNNTFQKQLDLAILYAYKDQKKSDVEEEQWSKILKEN